MFCVKTVYIKSMFVILFVITFFIIFKFFNVSCFHLINPTNIQRLQTQQGGVALCSSKSKNEFIKEFQNLFEYLT